MSAEPDMHALMMAASTSYRLQHSGVRVDGVVDLDFRKYPFVTEIIDERAPVTSIIKGAQMGLTIACIIRALADAETGNKRGIGYFFPTESEVSDFAKARFGPMMTNNPNIWGNIVKNTDSASLKRIGDTFLYFRGMGQKGSTGATRSTSKLKSIPLDDLYMDERDEMDDSRVDAAYHRLDGSMDPHIVMLSTPTLPGYGVDLEYAKSDQRVWMWKCPVCTDWTCLETNYPDCIAEPRDGDPFYLCEKCHEPLRKERGQWVARQTEIEDHRGYWISQLSSVTRTATQIVLALEQATESGRMKEFYNQNLARAYAEVEDEITAKQLEELVIQEPRPLRHEGPCSMGVDPGKPLWYTVRVRSSERDSSVIARGRADSYDDIHRIARMYNVESGVMDMGYDPTKVMEFVDAHPGWFGCQYVTGKLSDPDWNHKTRIVKVGRERLLDDAHQDIIEKRVTYHQKDEFWNEHFVPQMTNLKRSVSVDPKTGTQKAIWVVTGGKKNDHLRHADAYCHLAARRCGIAANVRRMATRAAGSRRSQRRRGRTAASM